MTATDLVIEDLAYENVALVDLVAGYRQEAIELVDRLAAALREVEFLRRDNARLRARLTPSAEVAA